MDIQGPILATTHLSPSADAALHEGHGLARRLGLPLVICHVSTDSPEASGETQHEIRERVRAHLDKTLGVPADSIKIETEYGKAHEGILAVAARVQAGLIVLGPGATAERVARAASLPVLVARPSPAFGSVLGATDFSDPALPAVRMAAAEAQRRGVPFRLLHCLDAREISYPVTVGLPAIVGISPLPATVMEQLEAAALERTAHALAATGVPGAPFVTYRQPAEGIVESARDVATSLIVVGTRSRSGLAHLLLGSVAEHVLRSAPCSVLVVPLGAAEKSPASGV